MSERTVNEVTALRASIADLQAENAALRLQVGVAETRVEGLRSELQTQVDEKLRLRAERDEALPYKEAVQATHNGYSPDARAAMPTLRKPVTPADAIVELLAEEREVTLREIAAERDALVVQHRERCEDVDALRRERGALAKTLMETAGLRGRLAEAEKDRDAAQAACAAMRETLVSIAIHGDGPDAAAWAGDVLAQSAPGQAFFDRLTKADTTLEAVSALCRERGFGQGELDSDLVACVRAMLDRLAKAEARCTQTQRTLNRMNGELNRAEAACAEMRAAIGTAHQQLGEQHPGVARKLLGRVLARPNPGQPILDRLAKAEGFCRRLAALYWQCTELSAEAAGVLVREIAAAYPAEEGEPK